MDIGVRFSSPVLDDLDKELFKDSFGKSTDDLIETLECAPYEISIIACLIKRLDYKLKVLESK